MKPRPAGLCLAALNTAIVLGALAHAFGQVIIWTITRNPRRHRTW